MTSELNFRPRCGKWRFSSLFNRDSVTGEGQGPRHESPCVLSTMFWSIHNQELQSRTTALESHWVLFLPCLRGQRTPCRSTSPILYPSLSFCWSVLDPSTLLVHLSSCDWPISSVPSFLANHSSGVSSDWSSSCPIFVLDHFIHFCWNFIEVNHLCNWCDQTLFSTYYPVTQ